MAPAVALADPPQVQITSLPTDVLSGSSVTMQYTVRTDNNGGGGGAPTSASIQVTGDGIRCNSGCGQITTIDGNGKSFSAQFTAPTVNAGATKTANIKITVTVQGEDPGETTQQVNVKGPDKPQTVTAVSGKVKDQNGKAIAGASVAMKDSAGTAFAATTNGSGGYSFNSTGSKPIAPGTITVGALKEGFEAATVQRQATAGKSLDVPLTLRAVEATASASPSASASASASAEATEDPAAEEPTTDDSVAADAGTKNTSADQGGGGSLLFILLGGLLVAAGVGAIVLVLMRRKGNGGGDGVDDDPTAMGGGGGGMVPPSQGRFNDATRVASPMGAGRDATMIAPRASGAPMADAPTMLQRPVEDEFPDPYGAPAPRQGSQYSGGWDDQAGGGAGAYGGNQYAEPAPQYGRPQDDGYGSATSVYGAAQPGAAGGGTYGAAAVGAGNEYGAGQPYGGGQQRYDEPTGMYRPEPGQDDYDEYDQRGGQYGAGAAGGGAAGGGAYGGAAAAGSAAGGGAYGGGQYGGGAGGYDDSRGGYEQGGYDQANGYGAQGGATYGSTAPAGGQYGGGTYGGSAGGGGGYEEYDQGSYDQRGGQYGGAGAGGQYGGGQYGGGGYDDNRNGYEQGGYDQAGYDQRGNRAPAQPTHPGQRRPSEWDN